MAGLAASLPPEELTFVLVDYKGGAAFDACAGLPHVVGLVTDLDQGLAERALRSLEAELRHRERVLRAAGAGALDDLGTAGRPSPLARLVVVVDEFATLKQDHPGFVDSLVSVAQRGRSLGVHLVLATQRPGGAVSDDIRANTDLRIALRVQDPSESTDVVGIPGAARLPRERPGRALLRRGPGTVVELQAAWAGRGVAPGARAVSFAPLRFGPRLAPPIPAGSVGPSELACLVEAVVAAHASVGGAPPRRPWVDPLPAVLPAEQLGDDGEPDELVLGWVDLPDEQRRAAAVWRPGEGGLLVVGSPGSGRTATLRMVAHAAATSTATATCHLYAVDLAGRGGLGCLAGLPQCGDVLGAADAERLVRLVRRLRRDLDARRRGGDPSPPSCPPVFVVVDGLPALLAALPEAGSGGIDDLLRILADGPAAGIHVAATADRPAAVPTAVAALLPQRMALHLADPFDAAPLGAAVARSLREVPGRAADVATGLLLQVAWVSEAAITALAERSSPVGGPGGPSSIGVLPPVVRLDDVVHGSEATSGRLRLTFALADDDLAPAGVELRDGEHVLVAGPARSGVSTALAALAVAARVAGLEVVALVGPRSGLGALVPPGAVVAAHAATAGALGRLDGVRPTLLVVDDAHDLDDPGGAMAGLLADPPPGCAVAAGGRTDLLRSAYGHWTGVVRRSRTGVLLQPAPELDGELLGTRLPRSVPTDVPGRGVLVAPGVVTVVQLATGDHLG